VLILSGLLRAQLDNSQYHLIKNINFTKQCFLAENSLFVCLSVYVLDLCLNNGC